MSLNISSYNKRKGGNRVEEQTREQGKRHSVKRKEETRCAGLVNLDRLPKIPTRLCALYVASNTMPECHPPTHKIWKVEDLKEEKK